ncbi:hypothetical protein CW304_26855 [Bacillus sp. UFRGS-B20]|nr:hypothetical protein CW304_26855 [Bacillus sp. UFRGS-B20]
MPSLPHFVPPKYLSLETNCYVFLSRNNHFLLFPFLKTKQERLFSLLYISAIVFTSAFHLPNPCSNQRSRVYCKSIFFH